MPGVTKNHHIVGLGFALLFSVLFSNVSLGQDMQNRTDTDTITLVLDPGHGGYDTGAHSKNGLMEKTLTLALARLIQDELNSRYTVFLTRDADYGLDFATRDAIANTNRARIFVSLHVGGGFAPGESGGSVYYFKPQAKPSLESNVTTTAEEDVYWDFLQTRHTLQSRLLAEHLREQLSDGIPYWTFKAMAAPLLILKGLSMPAVLIELGNLAHPADEKTLSDPIKLSQIAQTITAGIESYFKAPGGS